VLGGVKLSDLVIRSRASHQSRERYGHSVKKGASAAQTQGIFPYCKLSM